MSERPSWDEYFLDIALSVSTRADCKRSKVGAVVVNPEHKIIGTGYNGTSAGIPGCLQGACPRGNLSYEDIAANSDYNDIESAGYCISTHAEMNAVLHAYENIKGSTIYITRQPCQGCYKHLANAGIRRIVFATVGGMKEIK